MNKEVRRVTEIYTTNGFMALHPMDRVGIMLLSERRERVEHIEAFIVEDMMITAEGLYVPSGYKK